MKDLSLKIVHFYNPAEALPLLLPIFSSSVQAGFPSPADDHIEQKLDLNQMMVQHPAATFFVKVEGESMKDAGINSGDILVVDRSIETVSGKIVIAIVNGEFTVKRLIITAQGTYLRAENTAFPTLKIDEQMDFQIWGVVTYVVHRAE